MNLNLRLIIFVLLHSNRSTFAFVTNIHRGKLYNNPKLYSGNDQEYKDESNVSTLTPPESTETIERNNKEQQRANLKKSLFRVIGANNGSSISGINLDPVLANPETKEPLKIIPKGLIVAGSGGVRGSGVSVELKADDSKTYYGRTDTYFNLLSSSQEEDKPEDNDAGSPPFLNSDSLLLRSIRPLLPPPVSQRLFDVDYVPMRDLFTSPFVSYAYERGWRNSFSRAGFPGIDKEFELVRDYLKKSLDEEGRNTVVDMSCATGLMTRRLVKCGDYDRVIGCDYSDSMLSEARRRFNSEPGLTSGKTMLDLVRCDVGQIPMQDNSINGLHAGAAMHCWPDVQRGLNEIYRVLKPGGRYFATTFLSAYFSVIQNTDSRATNLRRQAFQNFKDMDQLRNYLVCAGFKDKNINIETIGNACVVMRCEK